MLNMKFKDNVAEVIVWHAGRQFFIVEFYRK